MAPRGGRGVIVSKFPRCWTLAALSVLAWGCDVPRMVPVAPPGLEITNEAPEKPEDAAEALGETRGAGSHPSTMVPAPPAAEPTKVGESKKLASGLVYETLKEGNGPAAVWGRTAVLHYTGKFPSGEQFDNSRDPNGPLKGKPLSVTLGKREVIWGMEMGLQGMKVGEQRRLTIPPALGYGENPQNKKIPPNATLIFDVELLGVQ